MDDKSATLVRVGAVGKFPKVSLIPPSEHGYLVLAAEVDNRPEFLYGLESGKKRRLLRDLTESARILARQPAVKNASLFKALIAPRGRGAYLKLRPWVHVARFDVVALIETESPAVAQELRSSAPILELEGLMRAASTHLQVIVAANTKQIGPVDHSRPGVFLFNFFYADSVEQNLAVWEYTAGWFQNQTGLDNSTVLKPVDESSTDYTIINHCRWNSLLDVVPSLVFKSSFRNYVLANFEANRTAAMPILYGLVPLKR